MFPPKNLGFSCKLSHQKSIEFTRLAPSLPGAAKFAAPCPEVDGSEDKNRKSWDLVSPLRAYICEHMWHIYHIYIYISYIYIWYNWYDIYNYIYRHIISINGPIIYGTNPIPLPSLTIILLSMVLVCPVPPMKSQWLVPNPIFPYPESSAQPVPPVPQDLGTQPTQSFHCRLLRLPWTKMDMPESILKLNIWVSPKLGPTIWIIWMMNTDDQPWFLLGIHHFETNPWLIQSRLMQQL